MSVFRAIGAEIALAFRLTFRAEVDLRPISGLRSRLGWIGDRHLRNGFLVAAPIFLGGLFLLTKPSPAVGLVIAVASNLVWFSASAAFRALDWKRNRAD